LNCINPAINPSHIFLSSLRILYYFQQQKNF
jgi:hypothetical protein